MNEQEPNWTRDGQHLKTTHAGFDCWVNEELDASIPWRWQVGKGRPPRLIEDGSAESMEIAQACALRAAEAVAVLRRCKQGDPPESSGFPPQFSTGEVCWEVVTKKRTDEERSMILVGLRMIKGVIKVVPDPDDRKRFVVHISNPSVPMGKAMIVIEGVVKTKRMEQ